MDTEEYTPKQDMSSKKWLEALKGAEKAFEDYNKRCDNIEKLHAKLSRLAGDGMDREFQIFWANMEVLRPSIYQRAPRPVVMPRQSDTGEVVRKASELLERCLEFDVEADGVHETLVMVRDDMALTARGVPWVLDNGQLIHVFRKDFRHDPARKWQEVDWVARCAYISKKEGRKRYGPIFKNAQANEVGKENEGDYQTTEAKVAVWQIYCKSENLVLEVAEGIPTVLDEYAPPVEIEGFFPCPKPAFGTCESATLLPVPDFAFYKQQVEEINQLTKRIHALGNSLRMKGFYAAGTSEVGEAVEELVKNMDDRTILVPVSNTAALGNASLKDAIIWLPVGEIASVIQQCVELRRQLIEDVYEITGLSDIMRGVTDAQETLGAQNLKAQFGSIRVREKQNQMIRVALEVLRIKAEIYAETVPIGELLQMAGMKLPLQAEVQQQAAQLQAQMQANPQAAQQIQAQLAQLQQTVTAEAVDNLLKSQRLRPFAMEVETDSTIAPNEEAEKASRIEFAGMVGEFIRSVGPAVQQMPQMAPFVGEILKFTAGGFRAGRDMGGAIDKLVEDLQQMGQQPQGQGEAAQAQAEVQKAQMENQTKQAELQLKGQELQLRAQEMQSKQALAEMDAQVKQFMAKIDAATKQAQMAIAADDQELKREKQTVDTLLAAEEIKIEREQQRAAKIGDD